MTAKQILQYIEDNNIGEHRNLCPKDNKVGKVWSASNRKWSGQRNYSDKVSWEATIQEAVERFAKGEFDVDLENGKFPK